MKYIFVLMFALVSFTAWACDVPTGNYRTVLHTHAGASLVLNQDQTFNVTFVSWHEGESVPLAQTDYNGTWACNGNSIDFQYAAEKVTAHYSGRSTSPLKMYKYSRAIVFPEGSHMYSLLSHGTFWPLPGQGEINEARLD